MRREHMLSTEYARSDGEGRALYGVLGATHIALLRFFARSLRDAGMRTSSLRAAFS